MVSRFVLHEAKALERATMVRLVEMSAVGSGFISSLILPPAEGTPWTSPVIMWLEAVSLESQDEVQCQIVDMSLVIPRF